MGNCCLNAYDLLNGGGDDADPRVLCHTCSIHPSRSCNNNKNNEKRRGWSSNNILGIKHSDIGQSYELREELGRGQFGVIRLCIHRVSGQRFACKSIAKSKLACNGDVKDVQREIQIMQQLAGHPNIVELKDVFEDSDWVHMVMELCEGGELFDRIMECKMYSERDAARVCKTLIEVLQFCHANGVIHRDLKPENILLASRSHPSDLKVADFGLAVHFQPGELHSGMAGSAYYIAPEVLRGEYGQEVDVWSAGVVLYVLLSGVPPFWDETEEGIFEAIRYGHLDLSSDPWPKRSSAVKELLRGMLCQDSRRRLTPGQILNHDWIVNNTKTVDGEFSLPSSLPHGNAKMGSWRSWQTTASASSSSSSGSDTGFLEGLLSADKTDVQKSETFKGFMFGNDADEIAEQQQRDSADSSKDNSMCWPPDSPRNSHKFDKWTSFTQVAEPTFNEFLAMVVSSLDNLSLPSPRANTEVQVEEGCICTILKASRSRRTVVVNSSKGKFLVVHDREHKRIGWKQKQDFSDCADQHAARSLPDLDRLLWSPYPISQTQ